MKCPNCERKLEELTEITGYHYWMCGNSDCEISYKFSRKAAQQNEQAEEVEIDPVTQALRNLGDAIAPDRR